MTVKKIGKRSWYSRLHSEIQKESKESSAAVIQIIMRTQREKIRFRKSYKTS